MPRQVHVYVNPDTLAALRRHRPAAGHSAIVREALSATLETLGHGEDYPRAHVELMLAMMSDLAVPDAQGERVSYTDREGLLARVRVATGDYSNADAARVALHHLRGLLDEAERQELAGEGAWAS